MEPLPRPFTLTEDLGQREATCPSHGPYVSVGRKLLRKELWSTCPGCAEDQRIADAAAEAALEIERTVQARAAALRAVDIPPRFIGCSFDNFKVDSDAQRHALTVARQHAEDIAENAKRGEGLIFAGTPGTGKTHLATAILQEVVAPRFSCRYITCLELIGAVRHTWRFEGQSEMQVLHELYTVDLLVIDEVGVQYGSDGEHTILFQVLDRRYRDKRPTILLTNQDKAGFKSFIGERSFDRLVQTCRWVPFDWSSYRSTARREAA